MLVTLYHNPACGTSRNVLALLRAQGIEPEIIDYLKTPLTRAQLQELTQCLGIASRELMRSKESIYKELNLDDAKWEGDDLLEQMARHPVLMNRPVVRIGRRAKLCRPAELVLELLGETGENA